MARRINNVWSHTNPAGECFVYARVGSGSKRHITVLGSCDDPEVKRFVELWEAGEVSQESDIETYLRQPIQDLPGPEGEAEVASQVDIEPELNLARNMFGGLKPREKTRLRAVVYQPTEETWDDASSIIVGADRGMTLWQAVIAVDPTFPRVGPTSDSRGRIVKRWERIPSQELLVRALRYATH